MKLPAMNTLATIENGLKISFVSGVALILAACSGDGREFEEAVETKQLDLASISIVQPAGLLDPLFVNPGEQINFLLEATRNGEDSVEKPLAAADRRWSVESVKTVDGNVIATTGRATIDDNGTFIGTADGVVTVSVEIGRLNDSFEVTVAQGQLTGIAISPVLRDPVASESTEGASMEGEPTVAESMLERCLPEMYTATGTYTDTSDAGMSTRGLPDIVEWSTANEKIGIASAQLNGATSVTAFEAKTLDLIASIGEVSSTKSIGVVDNLQGIDISPEVAGVMERSTVELTATGTYMRGGEESPSNITESVTWSINDPGDQALATVSNEESKKGLVTGVAVGSPIVTATCGDQFATKEVVVIENDGSGFGNLAFEGGPNRTIFLIQDRDGEQLNVSTGSVYDEENAITTDFKTTWSVSEGGRFVEFSSDPNRKGVIIPKAEGTAIIRVVIDDPDEAEEVGDAVAFQTIVVKP